MSTKLAPCVVVAGPANAGKTTLLHQLDRALQRRLESVLVIKGSPDGTGRYLFHQPELREALKPEVKGRWAPPTMERIGDWVEQGRRNLELALLDFGGKHNPENEKVLRRCSHYILVSREGDDEGAASWDRVCVDLGLSPVARMRSRWGWGGAGLEGGEGWFRSDAGGEDDETNLPAIEALAARLEEIRRPAEATPYINLHLTRDWTPADLHDLGGRQWAIRELAATVGTVVFGGVAPIWAYLAAMGEALRENGAVRIFFYNPIQEPRFVEIPASPAPGEDLGGLIAVEWSRREEWWRLHVSLTAADKLLPSGLARELASVPWPEAIPGTEVELFGARPAWLAGAYARWLWAAGVRRLAAWDARTNGPVWL